MSPKTLVVLLITLLIVSMIAGIGGGSFYISPLDSLKILVDNFGIGSATIDPRQEAVIEIIRLPRVLLGLLVGVALGTTGAVIQGIFRNPLADPGLIGISNGASLFAVMGIVVGVNLIPSLMIVSSAYALSIFAFIGAFTATIVVYRISQVNGKTMVATMLLVGIAINALTMSITGLFTYLADDIQLRSIAFWMLGSLGAASWKVVLGISPFVLIPALVLPLFSRSLNAFALGESNARHMGFNIESIKRWVIFLSAMAVGASVAVTGVIGFLGLVVPHIVRLIIGPDHKTLIVCSALLGAILLIDGDILARTIAAPTEIPIGIITSIIGAPFFLYIIIREGKKLQLS